ncbi:hypothetical protein PV371_09965 [Streptomyces sp. TX20-6-3]|uniref:hypothetical protein n=1 Tax=Streptomyces sp. TX20-6-3 TaxID=3028705 RepID=UPI0029A48720|nr:hypothetical protein [Streptomyces sp. TX20-6-3]MDX2559975.1 hypothetical protein [Streptomyces sp. TX20-6-3]
MSDAAQRTARTVLQTAVGIAVVLPAIVDASGVPATLPWVAGALAVAGGLTRVMALDPVQNLLPSWLRTDAGTRDPISTPAEGGADDRS